jgi:hypothetical protein
MSDDFFTVGPFKDSKKRIKKFNSYLYFNAYYNKTLVNILDLEEERDLALAIGDNATAIELDQKIKTYETMMVLASSLTLSASIATGDNIISYD